MRGKNLGAFFLLILVSLIFFSGCSREADVSRQDVLRIVTVDEPRSFNPYLNQPLPQSRWCFLVFDGLWEIDNQGNLKENLAYFPEFLEGGKAVKVRLKKGVFWHDKSPFTARDVEFTWKLLSGKAGSDYFSSPVLYPAYSQIRDVAVEGDYELTFYLDRPNYQFAYLFPCILPEHILGKEKDIVFSSFWFKPVGTGPYRLSRWEIGKKMVFEANEDYFKGRPKIKEIEVSVVFSPEEAEQMIEEGKVGLWQDIPEDEVNKLKEFKPKGWSLIKYPVGWEAVFFNTKSPLLKVADLREAIFYGIDWAGARSFLKKEEAGVFALSPIKKYRKFTEEFQVRLNRKKAVEALHRQGYKNIGFMKLWEKKRNETFRPRLAFDARFQFFGKNRYRLFLEFLRSDAEKTKIDLIVNFPTSRMLSAPKEKSGNIVTARNFDLLYFSQHFYPHPLLRKPFTSAEDPRVNDRGLNFSYYFSEEIEKSYQAAERASSEKKEIEYLKKIYLELYQQKVLVPMGFVYYYSFVSPSLSGYEPPFFWESSFYNVENWEK